MATPIDLIMRLKDMASTQAVTAMRKIDAGMGGLKATALRLGSALVAAFSIYKLIAFEKKGIETAREAEKNETRLAAVYKATGGAVNLTLQELREYNSELKKNTGASGGAISAASAILLTFRQIKGDVFKKASEYALDMAHVFGGDASTAAMQLGKALHNPIDGITRLKRVGVTFTEEQKKQIEVLMASGRVFEAQGVILNELENEVGGVARAMRNNYDGSLRAYENGWKSVYKASGDFVVKSPAVVAAINAAANILSDTGKEMEKMGPLSGTMMKQVVTAFSWLAKSGLLVRGIFNGITYSIQGVELVAVSLYEKILKGQLAVLNLFNDNTNDGIIKWMKGSTEAGINGINDFSEAIKKGMNQDAEDIKATIKLFEDIGKAAEDARNLIDKAKPLEQSKRKNTEYDDGGKVEDEKDALKRLKDEREELMKSAGFGENRKKITPDKTKSQELADTKKLTEAESQRAANAVTNDAILESLDRNAGYRADNQKADAERQEAADRALVEAKKEAVSELGSLARNYTRERLTEIENTARLMRQAGEDEVSIARWTAEQVHQIRIDSLRADLEAANSYGDALAARMALDSENHRGFAREAANETVDQIHNTNSAIAQGVAQIAVYEANGVKVGQNILKSAAAEMVSFYTKALLEWLIFAQGEKAMNVDKAATAVGASASQTYAAAFASSVGLMGPAAAGYAAGLTAVMTAGSVASYMPAFAAMMGATGAGQADRGMVVPSDGSYMMNLKKGELLLPPSRSPGGSLSPLPADVGPTQINLNVSMQVDGRELGQIVAELGRDGKLVSGNYAIKAKALR